MGLRFGKSRCLNGPIGYRWTLPLVDESSGIMKFLIRSQLRMRTKGTASVEFVGELASLAASVFFGITSTFFALAGRKIGPALTLRAGQLFGLVCIVGLHWLLLGQPFPTDVEPWRWLILGVSGILGYGLAFLLMINSFMWIGPRLALLVASLTPILGALLAWIFLGEILDLLSIIGIVVTIGGIVFVVTENGQPNNYSDAPEAFRNGLMYAFGSAIMQAIAFVLSKEGVRGEFEPLSGTLIRSIVAVAALWIFTAIRGQLAESVRKLRANPRVLRELSIGGIAGPVFGASLVLLGLQHASVGVASTLSNLTPIVLIPIGYFVFHDHISRRSIIGTFIAVVGTAILFF